MQSEKNKQSINATLRLPARAPADETHTAANGKEERVSTQPARAGGGGRVIISPIVLLRECVKYTVSHYALAAHGAVGRRTSIL